MAGGNREPRLGKPPTVKTLAGPGLLTGFFFFMAFVSWRKWPDILVDFGHELYTPWQLLSGKMLYRDIAFLYGPFSQYFNSFLFACFGISFSTLVYANIILLTGVLTVLYLAFGELFDRVTSFGCSAVFLLVFAFAQNVGIGNYNFVSPYSHEATHGIVLAAVLMCLLWRFVTRHHSYLLTAAGVVLGLIFMTRAEVAIAAAAYTVCFLTLSLIHSDRKGRTAVKWILLLTGGALLPATAFFFFFLMAMSFPEALRATGGAWTMALRSDVFSNRFFTAGMGFDQALKNTLTMLKGTAWPVLITGLYVWLDRSGSTIKKRIARVVQPVVLFTAVYLAFTVTIYEVGRPLPCLVFLSLIVLFRAFLKTSSGRKNIQNILAFAVSFTVFGAMLLFKIALNCRFYHYGFYLALPSTLLVCVFLLWFIPRRLLNPGTSSEIFRWVALTVILILAARCVRVSNTIYRSKSFPVGSGADRIMTYAPEEDPRGPAVIDTLLWIHQNMRSDETLLALPEGIIINYLTGRTNPSAYTTFMMTEMLAFGEENMLDNLRKNPPDYVILVHKDTSEFGVNFFGSDPRYGRKILTWIEQAYTPVHLYGNEPLKNDYFGVKIVKKNQPRER